MNVNIPKRRFKGFSEDWEQEKLSNMANIVGGGTPSTKYIAGKKVKSEKMKLNDFLEEVIEYSDKENQYPLLSSTNNGIETRSGRVSGSSNIGYKILRKNQLVLSPQNLWLGNININRDFEVGIVSPSYKVFDIKNIKIIYLENILKTERMKYNFEKISIQGASVVRRNLDMKEFLNLEVRVTQKNEQEKIGKLLSSIDKAISLHKRKFEKLKQLQKSYLNESILSEPKCIPKRRFKGFVEPWEQEKLGVICDFKVGGDVDKVKLLEKGKYPVIANGKENEGIIGYYRDYRFSEGKVTVSGRGDVGYAKLRERPFTPVVRLIVISSSVIQGKFLELLINNLKIYNESTGVPQLTAPQLSTYSVSFPSQEEQLKISNMILYYEKLITLHKNKRDTIQKLQKIYLQNNLEDETYA